jgi:broad specificity phosphatase PhoE
MTKLILIPAAQTDWRAQGRLAGDTDLPLNECGQRQAVSFGEAVAGLHPAAVHCGPEKATKQTATIVAHELSLKARTSADLREMDLGHWEGLSEDDFRERFAKVYRQWRSAPASVKPPEGEAVAHAAKRLQKGVQKILKRHQNQTVVLTLGQFAYAILRCRLSDGGYEQFWEYVNDDGQWCTVQLDQVPGTDSSASDADQPTEP